MIPRFGDYNGLNKAANDGHILIVPADYETIENSSDTIVLPEIERDSFVASLISVGFSKEKAQRHSRESARNITILRRQLEFTRTIPNWAHSQNVNTIIPALIIGRWDENSESDKNIIAKIANDTYESYIKELNCWRYTNDSPIFKIGSKWRLSSPLDSWANASKQMSRNDFDLLKQSAIEILSEVDPSFQLQPEHRNMASFFGKKRNHSAWIREGIIHSLILISVFGEKFKLDLPSTSKVWVDNIVRNLLNSNNPEFWKSLDRELPLLAEASPTAFLDNLEKYLKIESSPIIDLFNEEPGFIAPRSYHTGLLWALESLAWFPEYLSRVSIILAKLASNDPGGQISNRPIKSLSGIFKPWHYETYASFTDRIEVLELICKKELEVAWTLLLSMLPKNTSDFSTPSSKPRWRLLEIEQEIKITWDEIYKSYTQVVELLKSHFDYSDKKTADLIKASCHLLVEDRHTILDFVDTILDEVNHEDNISWHACRKLLNKYNSHPEADWVLPLNDLERIANLHMKLTPSDTVQRNIWMFNDNWPEFSEGHVNKKGSHDNQEIIILENRKKALLAIYNEVGLVKVIELSEVVKEKEIFGQTLAYIIESNNEIVDICKILNETKANYSFAQGCIFRKGLIKRLDWSLNLYKKLKKIGFSNSSLANFLTCLYQSQQLWDFIETTNSEIIELYWKNCYTNLYRTNQNEKIYEVRKLIEHKRYFYAIQVCSPFAKELPSDLISDMLLKAGTEKNEEHIKLSEYEINALFNTLNDRNDLESSIMFRLEWIYFPVLNDYDDKTTLRLHEELSINPEFFIQILCLIYKSDNESIQDDSIDEQLKFKAKKAFELLESWNRLPGMNSPETMDFNYLKTWIDKVTELAKASDLMEAANMYIGKILAQYPESLNETWPPDEICKLIEELNCDVIDSNFSCATFNKRSSSSRSPFEGGNIEREKAQYFHKLANHHKNKYPSVFNIFHELAIEYEDDAKKEDEKAVRIRMEY